MENDILKDRKNALIFAYSILTDKRNTNKYAFSVLTNKKTMERFGYSDTLRALEEMYSELDEAHVKPMQKPILLKPGMDAECDDNGLVPFYIEHRYTVEINAGIYDTRNDQLFYDMGEAVSEWIDNEEQGKTWRAWAARPTDDERAAAKWE